MVPVSQSIEMNEVPQVFRATYSSTDVFECIVNEFPIMRRCKDGWVNATQILKCCNFPKAKRTKILEKGVQSGLHEKIQGGFGKFQGTWIPLPDAQKLATEYGLTGTMAPVLFLDLSDPGLKIPLKVKPPPKEPTPVKRKYTKKAKKVDETPTKKYKGESFETPGSLNQPFMQFSQNQQVQLQQLPPSFQQPEFRQIGQNSQQMPQNIQGQAVQPHSQFSSHNQTAQQEFQNYQVAQMQRIQQQQLQQQQQLHQQQQLQQNSLQQLHGIPQQVSLQQQAQIQQIQQLQQVQQVQQQFQRTSQIHPNQHSITANVSVDQLGQKQAGKFYSPQFPVQQLGFQDPSPVGISAQSKPSSQSTNENWSQDEINHSQMAKDSDTSISSNEEHNNNSQSFHLQDKQSFADESMMSPPSQSANTTRSSIPEKETYAQQLLRFFSDDHAQIPYFVNNLPFDFDINDPIDDEGHTPLHWAASIGNYQMIHLLLIKGSNPLVVNNFGLNPLSKLISFNNCYELKNFPKVLDDLELCLINTDINGRTPLHYLCQFAKIKSKYESLRYYLQIILNKLSTLSQSNNSDKPQVDLLKNVLDHQDINGDTCLHLAIKSGSTKIMNALLKYGARDDLENINEQTARQLIMHYNLETYEDKHPEQYAEHITQNEHSRHHASTSEASEVPQIGQLGPSQMNPPNSSQVSEAALYQEPYQVLATPVQPYGNGSVDTPDTQRTTIQTDDIEEDDSAANGSSFVKSELSKANIFMEEKEYEKNYASKEYDEKDYNKVSDFNSLSTPVKNRSNSIVPHSALAVISERTVESTPVQAREAVISYKPRPPILGEDGKIKESDADPECDEAKLSMNDLSSMVSGMINSLSDSYREQLAELNNESKRLNAEIVGKKHLNEASLEGFQKSLDGHIESSQMSSVTEGEDLLSKVIDEQQAAIDLQEVKLLNSLTSENASKLYEAVEEEEYATTGETGAIETDNGDDLEEQFMCAMELTQLQMQKSDLLIRLTSGVKNFGIDNKMYKYRKLISLSCGLKVEDIDSLIDGIEESLMQAS